MGQPPRLIKKPNNKTMRIRARGPTRVIEGKKIKRRRGGHEKPQIRVFKEITKAVFGFIHVRRTRILHKL